VSEAIRARLVAAALAWVGTPYRDRHYPRRGIGCDCVTLLMGVGLDAGLFPPDLPMPVYSSQRHRHRSDEAFLAGLLKHGFTRLPPAAALPGDVLLEVLGRGLPSSHANIVVAHDGTRPRWIVHASNQNGINRVCRYRLDDRHWSRVRFAFRFPGVDP